ncbi:hypothetical protein KL918_002914 [Ogataea parapolymorpha]|nr:hypothetical protein KL918_002914 [Ogataea parapolymorpha]KAG7871861.1 hypothetical protein KL916_003711 [Ogataea parapolymorpha]
MDTESSVSLHTPTKEQIQFPHGSTRKQSTKRIKTNDEGFQTQKSKRAFSFSKFIGSTLQDKNEDKKKFEYSTNEQTCNQAPTIQSRSRWIRPLLSIHSLFKTRNKVISLPEKENSVLTSEFDLQKDAMFSCYNAFKNTEIQNTLNSLKESIDSNLLQKSTVRFIHYRHQDGVGKALKPGINNNNKETRDMMNKAQGNKTIPSKIVNQMSENRQIANMLGLKQIRADKGDNELMSGCLNTQSMSTSFCEQNNYMTETDTSANCAPGIYLNSELTKLFNSLRLEVDHEKSRFYVASDANSHSFPDFELSSQISVNEVSGESLLKEDSIDGPLSSFIEESTKEFSHCCEHELSQRDSSLSNSYGKYTSLRRAY